MEYFKNASKIYFRTQRCVRFFLSAIFFSLRKFSFRKKVSGKKSINYFLCRWRQSINFEAEKVTERFCPNSNVGQELMEVKIKRRQGRVATKQKAATITKKWSRFFFRFQGWTCLVCDNFQLSLWLVCLTSNLGRHGVTSSIKKVRWCGANHVIWQGRHLTPP